MKFINCTPHAITAVNNRGEEVTFEPSGILPRVQNVISAREDLSGFTTQTSKVGDVTGLPEACDGVFIIVSGMVLAAANDRTDLVAPATGPADGCIRNEKGHIVAVTKFNRN